MRRLLILIIVLYVVWRVLGIVGRRRAMADARERVRGVGAKGRDRGPDRTRQLVPCARCGTLVPEDRAVRGSDGNLYCAATCLEAGTEKPDSRNDTLPPPSQPA